MLSWCLLVQTRVLVRTSLTSRCDSEDDMTMTSQEYKLALRLLSLRAQGRFVGPVLPLPPVLRVQYQPRGTRY